MPTEAETLPAKVQELRVKFRELLEKTNKDHPRPQDVAALADLLNSNQGLQIWRDVLRPHNMLSALLLTTLLLSPE